MATAGCRKKVSMTMRLEKRRVWVVDPLDGTREFVAGIPSSAHRSPWWKMAGQSPPESTILPPTKLSWDQFGPGSLTTEEP